MNKKRQRWVPPDSTWDLKRLLHPFDWNSFLRVKLSQSFLHVVGNSKKFTEILNWPALNYILSNTGVDSSRIRVTKGEFQEPPASLFRNDGAALHLGELNRRLLDGALLTIDSIEDVCIPFAQLCHGIEAQLAVPILQTQVHATFRPGLGVGVRRNDHDMFVLNVSGSKSWTLYGPGKDKPVLEEMNPAWSDTLTDGDLLYVPRGWWYVEQSLDSPALHLAIAFRNPTGIEFAARVIEKLVHSPFMTADFPRFQNEELRARYLTQLQYEISQAFGEPGVILDYFKDVRALAAPRRLVGLPWSLTDAASIPRRCIIVSTLRFSGEDTRIRAKHDNFIEISHDGNTIQVSDSLEPILRAIFDEGGYSIEMLIDRCAMASPENSVIKLLSSLLKLGLVIAVEPHNRPDLILSQKDLSPKMASLK